MVTMNSTATTEEQYRQVYEGIVAVAAHCDGARSLDGVGFNGQDTLFGKRIAAVPFDQWTQDIRQETARIALTYKVQILNYTGVDMAELDVVREARGLSTNRAARDQARGFEKRAGAKARRICDATPDGKLALSWSRDPDFGAMLDAVQKLPGRRYDRPNTRNLVDVTPQAEDFTLVWDFQVTAAADELFIRMAQGAQEPARIEYDVTLHSSGRIIVKPLKFSYDWLDDVKALPGRDYQPAGFTNKENVCLAHPQVLVVAAKHGWNVHPDAAHACEKARKAAEARAASELEAGDRAALMVDVSMAKDPAALPPAFVDMVNTLLKGVQK